MERLTDGELRLMEVLWDLAPINSTQPYEHFPQGN